MKTSWGDRSVQLRPWPPCFQHVTQLALSFLVPISPKTYCRTVGCSPFSSQRSETGTLSKRCRLRMATFSSAVQCLRSFLKRSLRYLSERTRSPFPTEAGQNRDLVRQDRTRGHRARHLHELTARGLLSELARKPSGSINAYSAVEILRLATSVHSRTTPGLQTRSECSIAVEKSHRTRTSTEPDLPPLVIPEQLRQRHRRIVSGCRFLRAELGLGDHSLCRIWYWNVS